VGVVFRLGVRVSRELTHVNAKAIRAHVTTMASRMFHKSRQYERGWNITPRSITCSTPGTVYL